MRVAHNAIDLTGQRFGRLFVVSLAGKVGGRRVWLCRCDCGGEATVQVTHLKSGGQRSCGCLRAETSKLKATKYGIGEKLRQVWYDMVARCHNENHASFKNYGGRGISVCDQWRDNPKQFFNDVGYPPPGMEIDRINNDGNYEPGNCRWVTHTENCNNRRNTIFETFDGKRVPLAQLAREHGINSSTLYYRVRRFGWPIERALSC